MPKIIFRYSYPYDRHWHGWIKQKPNLLKRKSLNKSEVFKIINQLERFWHPIEREILIEISDVLKLNWKEREIICYIVSNGHGISDPMTVGINKRSPEKIINTIIHELTHRIFIQEGNQEKTKNSWVQIRNKYPDQSNITYVHIVCFSLLKKLYLKFLNEEKLEAEIKRCEKKDDYRKAWDIVEKEGYIEILDRFKESY